MFITDQGLAAPPPHHVRRVPDVTRPGDGPRDPGEHRDQQDHRGQGPERGERLDQDADV